MTIAAHTILPCSKYAVVRPKWTWQSKYEANPRVAVLLRNYLVPSILGTIEVDRVSENDDRSTARGVYNYAIVLRVVFPVDQDDELHVRRILGKRTVD